MRSEEYKLSYDKGLPLNEDMREVRLTRNQYKNKFE